MACSWISCEPITRSRETVTTMRSQRFLLGVSLVVILCGAATAFAGPISCRSGGNDAPRGCNTDRSPRDCGTLGNGSCDKTACGLLDCKKPVCSPPSCDTGCKPPPCNNNGGGCEHAPSVPEPGTLTLLLGGLIGLTRVSRRRFAS
jgi:hypothetical protein